MKTIKVPGIEYTIKLLDYSTNNVIEVFDYPWSNEVNYPIIPNIGDTIISWKGKYTIKKVEREINLLTEWEHDYITVYVEKIKIDDIKHGL